ncbi:MAG TPA: tRNA pseudouridine(38-40) synthase TruA [Candidatus Dormibacteraeota bacterium]
MAAASSAWYRLTVAYDGTGFHGWQIQPGVRTCQGELTRALIRLTGEEPHLTAAGRTDAGAHAHGQVVGFGLRSSWRPEALLGGCNAMLPADIAVRGAAVASPDFHPRWRAWRRSYRYLISDGQGGGPLGRNYSWQIKDRLELAPMRAAARHLLGRHDFAAFGASPAPAQSSVRTVDRAEVERSSGALLLEVRADAFLRGMMRGIAGALMAVGSGRARVEDVERAVTDPTGPVPAWSSAPARGLHQWRVEYRGPSTEMAS